MKAFRLGQEVWVRRFGRDAEHETPMNCLGVVVRLCISHGAAWVKLRERHPSLEGLVPFPEGDDRATNVMVWPEDAEPVRGRRVMPADV